MTMGLPAGEHPGGLGAQALGALGPAEAAAVREHTAHCRDCRQQLDEFAEVTDMLDQVPLAALLDSSPDRGKLLSSSTGTGPVAT